MAITCIDPQGTKHFFHKANHVSRSNEYTDLYEGKDQKEWVAQIPNTWAIIDGDSGFFTSRPLNRLDTEEAEKQIMRVANSAIRRIQKAGKK